MNTKDSKSFDKIKQELKHIFKINKNAPGSNNNKFRDEPILTTETEHEISSESPIELRLKTIKVLGEAVLYHKLEEHAIEKLCRFTEDILLDHHKEHRRIVLTFYQCLVEGQYDRLGLLRTYFFNIIKTHEHIDDNIPRLELFQKLTDNGRDISNFEQEVGLFLLDWMPVIVANSKSAEFLAILVRYIKYNAGDIDDDVISGIILNTSYLCCQSGEYVVVKGSLEVLDTIVCYSNISQQTMATFISALSRTVCLEQYHPTSWKIMRNLLGTYMGRFCLQTMCQMLQDENNYSDTGLVSGIIFNLNMALLFNKPDCIVNYIPSFIIPSIFKAAHCDDPVILLEVGLCIKWLVEKYGEELKDPLWDRIFNILDTLIGKCEKSDSRIQQCQTYIHDVFSKIDSLLQNNQFKGDTEKLFQFDNHRNRVMPESLISRLIDHQAKFIIPIESDWISKLRSLLENFYVNESRRNIKLKALKVFLNILQQNRYHYEKDLIRGIVVPYFSKVGLEKDPVVRNVTIKDLLQLCSLCKTSHMEFILDIFEKVLRIPFENEEIMKNENDYAEIMKTILGGLLEIFVISIYQLPSSNAINILSILVAFLQNHYRKPHLFESIMETRWMVIDCLLKLRSDSKYRLGYSDEQSPVKYSSYLIVDYRRSSNVSLSAVSSADSRSSTSSSFEDDFLPNEISFITLSSACQVVVTALSYEKDWRLLNRILQAIPTALKNKALILSRYNGDVEPLIRVLISMITEGHLPDALKNTPPRFTKPEFYSHIIPVLSVFASHHTHLESSQQQRLIRCLQQGLVLKSAPQCVTALMTCLLEMRDAMVKLLPEVLLNLSKISATVHVAIPTLEFLSMLTTFPKVFANFTPNQYMSIFAIILPYTNPFKYDHYTVSLAHHVIAVWFLKCRKPFRQDLVKYIIKGLKTNVLSSFEEGHFVKNDNVNEDSSNRKRSSSLTEQGNKRKERHMSGSGRLVSSRGGSSVCDANKNETLTFHRELTDTCIDLMSRVAFTSCSALPNRHPSTDFVLHNGPSNTWLLGLKLITIRTSGCTQKPIRNGLCEKCSNICIIDRNPDLNKSHDSNDEVLNDFNDRGRLEDAVNTPRNLLADKNYSENASVLNSVPNSVSSSINSSLNVSSGGEEKKVAENSDLKEYEAQDQCICWCQGWAEIHIRRPTGDTSWIMRIQNETNSLGNSDPMIDMSTINQPSFIQQGSKIQDTSLGSNIEDEHIMRESVRSMSDPLSGTLGTSFDFDTNVQLSQKELGDTPIVKPDSQSGRNISVTESVPIPFITSSDDQFDTCADSSQHDHYCHGRNPVRRSNSSPEMSSNWKNNYLKDSSRSFNSSPVNEFEQNMGNEILCTAAECRKSGKCYPKELRNNCEAIPEEFSGQGTTPPKIGFVTTGPDMKEKIHGPNESFQMQLPSGEKSPDSKSILSKVPSFSYENDIPKEEKKIENSFFDKQSLPNEHFEFNRSASVSQVAPSRRSQLSSGYAALSHNLASSQPHLTTKPPPSPPTYSSRVSNRYSKDGSPIESRSDSFGQSSDYKRYRFNTISVMSVTKKSCESEPIRNRTVRTNETKKSGVNPSFVFLQLYDPSQFHNSVEKPLLVGQSKDIERSINVFDRIPPYETHKVGVIYVGPGQANKETEILRNSYGSGRYAEFLSKLGTLVRLEEVNSQSIFLGGLEQNGNDGKFAYIWKDDVMQVIFHVATLMPNKETDIQCSNKKTHIGNDFVTIVYNESEEEYDLQTVKCQFNFACVIIEPLDHGNNQLTIKARDELKKLIGPVEKKIVSDKNVSLLARQLALHINLASLILRSLNENNYGGIYASNWLERLRKIKRIKDNFEKEAKLSADPNDSNHNMQNSRRNYSYDFTEYIS